jgi:predicted transcriptional regulator
METLWDRGPSTVSDVQAALVDPLAYTTVLTILRTLEEKGYVGHDSVGRAHRYKPLIERDVAQRSALEALSEKLFNGSAELVVTRLVADAKLTPQQIERIRRLIDERLGGPGAKRSGGSGQ